MSTAKSTLRVGPYGFEPHDVEALNRVAMIAIQSGAQDSIDHKVDNVWKVDEKKTWAAAVMRIAWAFERGMGVSQAFTCCDWFGTPRPNTAYVRSRAQGHPELAGYSTHWELEDPDSVDGPKRWDSIPASLVDTPNDAWPDGLRCVCRIARRHANGVESITERSFSVGMAKRQDLWDTRAEITRGSYTKANPSPWFRNPADMIRSRAEDRACWGAFADAIEARQPREGNPTFWPAPSVSEPSVRLHGRAVVDRDTGEIVPSDTGEVVANVGVAETSAAAAEGQEPAPVKQTAEIPETDATKTPGEPDDLGVSPTFDCDCPDAGKETPDESIPATSTRAGQEWRLGGDDVVTGYTCLICLGFITASRVSSTSSSSQTATSEGGSGNW